jgi:uncharacterized protein DUF3147
MLVKFESTSLRETKWSDYATRFIFGGAVTLLAGLIADRYGPGIGGLFLAFPAIFPASASLIQKHERQKKERAGLDGIKRGRLAAGIDAAGATVGCVGLLAFATVAWKLLPRCPLWLVLIIATLAWAVLSISVWFARKRAPCQS